ncbi:two-component system response regulator [Crocosphaera chwakensis]|uniref:Putative diguanylate cyclase/phosphodiesterase (GGDEF & EAL domains) with Response Regulator Receiver modulation n=1 Tax=Crocosphaera chwakensis CCY0110 TaxID=391612 RepID=A3IWY5_9CHRO|nr:GGDEF domain-containing response regulator [Crocosphaera chwakensis]EAZ89036.1 Putative diguanylate cyclase/phosphodiesterase (GGDEF & EAL domains) with Response Regulator Receiver modulation [Crocosphaera chwakensis CCY0110]
MTPNPKNEDVFLKCTTKQLSSNLQDILIVDDTIENLRVLSSILTAQGYNVRKATGGHMALKVVKTLPPDLIMLDIMMADLNGYDVCEQLKQNPRTADIPVIFLSALDDVFDKVKAFEMGGVDYICKPFQMEEVLVRVKNQLALRTAQKEVYQLNTQLEKKVQERTQQLQEANDRLQKIALYDSLTNLANRNSLIEELQQSLNRIKLDNNHQFAVLFLDCDRFKIINDSLGHLVGNLLLKKISQALKTIIGKNETLARIGGDEFAILLSDISGVEQAKELAQNILNLLKKPFYSNSQEIFINVSIGIVLSHPDYQDPENIIRDADMAMYKAKSLGRGQYQIFTPEMYDIAQQLLILQTDLYRAVQQEEFTVYYQPIIDLKENKIAGFEALIRWIHPQKGMISPGEFLPLAEETGLICEIGSWVMKEACSQLSQWHEQGFTDLKICINLSAQQLNQSNLVTEIDGILIKNQLQTNSVKLEITESSMMQDLQTTKVLLGELWQRGIKLSIDDFGTGYSSLSQLQNFPVNTLKIDRCFLKNIGGDGENLGLVPVILSIAEVMTMDVVAEGIETSEQLEQLRKLGCHFGQGFFFAKPLDAETATQLIHDNPTW